MSGTSYGGCLLHCAPEAFVGGPLALVQSGDRITVDAPARRIHLEVSDTELARRRAVAPPGPCHRVDMNVATAGSSASTSCKPTKAAISIFLKPRSARRCLNR